MRFNLTQELTDSIISAMENQEAVFAVDASRGELAECGSGVQVDEDTFYAVPEWKPADGFALRENFVSNLHAPLAREELASVLHSGRGVFKNFRTVLKNYPEVDRRWHSFKYRIMSAKVNEWYNSLREIWGLEKLAYESDSEESLLYDDFSFTEYSAKSDARLILSAVSPDFFDEADSLPRAVCGLIYKMWRNQFECANDTGQTGYICRSLSEEFAGCITASSITTRQDKAFAVTSLFVPEHFRGLGIATELLSLCAAGLQKSGAEWLFMPDGLVPECLQPLLLRTGFKKSASGYLAAMGQR